MQSYDKLDLNDLKAFLAVAHCGSFTQAAEQMGVAKSRISQQIQRLESGLGVALFHRTTRRVRLTLSGESLIEECEPIMQGLADALVRAGGCRLPPFLSPSSSPFALASHAPEELTSWEDIEVGANVLLHTMLDLASGDA